MKIDYKLKRTGRKSSAQTPAPNSDNIKGSKVNKVGSATAKGSSSIQLSDTTITALKNKLEEFKDKYSRNEKVTLNDLKSVYRRGSGAYSTSHRPGISRAGWSYARVNKFLEKAAGKKVKAAYVQDDDLLKYENGGYLNDEAQQLVDIISMGKDNPKYFKYKEILKSKFNIDYDLDYGNNDENIIENADLNNLKTINDFLNYDNYVKYCYKIFRKRGFVENTYNHIEGIVTIELAKKVGSYLGFVVELKEYFGVGNYAENVGDIIRMPQEVDINTFIHEIGHFFDHQYSKEYEGKAKNSLYATSIYMINKSDEVFAENFLAYFVAPEWLMINMPIVFYELDEKIPKSYKSIINDLINDVNGSNSNLKYEDGGEVKSFYTWFSNWYKSVSKDIDIMISLPNAISGLKPIPNKEDNVVILEMFRKIDQNIDAKQYLQTILNKADEYKVTIYLLPDPNYKYIDDIQYRKKVSKKYLIDYYKRFGFELSADKEFMKRNYKYAKGGEVNNSLDYIMSNKVIFENGYYFDMNGLSTMVDPYAQTPLNLDFTMVSYNSLSNYNIDIADTINHKVIINKLIDLFMLTRSQSYAVVDTFMRQAKRFTSSSEIKTTEIVIVDNDKVVFENINNKQLDKKIEKWYRKYNGNDPFSYNKDTKTKYGSGIYFSNQPNSRFDGDKEIEVMIQYKNPKIYQNSRTIPNINFIKDSKKEISNLADRLFEQGYDAIIIKHSNTFGDELIIRDKSLIISEYDDNGGKEITCVNCSWHWNTKDSDEYDKYICHKCGFDNRTFYDSELIGQYEDGGEIKENRKSALDTILEEAKPFQEKLLQNWIELYKKEEKKEPTNFMIEEYRFILIMDLVKAIGNYLEQTDIINKIRFAEDAKSIVIDAIVERDGQEYSFYTDVITAGGYNIQRLHYRYIVNTKLPHKKSNKEYDKLNDEFKRMTNVEKIKEELFYSYKHIVRLIGNIEEVKEQYKLSGSEDDNARIKNLKSSLKGEIKENEKLNKKLLKLIGEYEDGGEVKEDKSISLPDSYAKESNLKRILNMQGYELSKITDEEENEDIMKKGGVVVGKSHKEADENGTGEKFEVASTGQIVELEGGEGVIVNKAMDSKELLSFGDDKMTPKEISSYLNHAYGGVKFEKGGAIMCGCSKKKYYHGGELPSAVVNSLEGGEAVITKRTMDSKDLYTFEGKRLTPRQILSRINHRYGGVSFSKKA